MARTNAKTVKAAKKRRTTLRNKENNSFLQGLDEETRAIYAVAKALVGLEFDAKRRVLLYACGRWGIDAGKLVGSIEGGHTLCNGDIMPQPKGPTGTAR